MGDRSGSREPKLSSLKKSKKNPGAPAGRVKKVAKSVPLPTTTLPPPLPKSGLYVDCAVALLSRQFDRDRDRILARAQEDNVSCIISWFSDIEKQQMLSDLCKANSGFTYFITGIHPDNVERTNKKSHDSWIERIEELSRRPECVGIISGLNLSRDIGTHFPQESLLRASCAISQKVLLPLILHCPGPSSLDRILEILKEEGVISSSSSLDSNHDNLEISTAITLNRRILIHDPITASGCNIDKLHIPITYNFGFLVSAVGLTDEDSTIRQKAKQVLKQLPLENILSCTDSPWRTPQNIPDTYLRTLRNEPCNIMYVIQAIADAYEKTTDIENIYKLLKKNAYEIFGLEFNHHSFTHEDSSNSNNNNSSSSTSAHLSTPIIVSNNNNEEFHPVQHTDDSDHDDHDDNDDDHDNDADDNDNDKEESSSPNNDDEDNLKNNNIKELSDINMSSVYNDLKEKQLTSIPNIIKEYTKTYYGCVKCRTYLFNEIHVSKHAFDITKTVFQVGEEGLCQTVIFIPCKSSMDFLSRTQLCIKGYDQIQDKKALLLLDSSSNNDSYPIECITCHSKIGKYYIQEAHCACGALIHGPVARLQAIKMDYFDTSLDQEALIHKMKQEAQDVTILNQYEELEMAEHLDKLTILKKLKKKSKIVSSNKGNFSSFRNKSFIPNASRSAAKKADESTIGGDITSDSISVGAIADGSDHIHVHDDTENVEEDYDGSGSGGDDEEEEEGSDNDSENESEDNQKKGGVNKVETEDYSHTRTSDENKILTDNTKKLQKDSTSTSSSLLYKESEIKASDSHTATTSDVPVVKKKSKATTTTTIPVKVHSRNKVQINFAALDDDDEDEDEDEDD